MFFTHTYYTHYTVQHVQTFALFRNISNNFKCKLLFLLFFGVYASSHPIPSHFTPFRPISWTGISYIDRVWIVFCVFISIYECIQIDIGTYVRCISIIIKSEAWIVPVNLIFLVVIRFQQFNCSICFFHRFVFGGLNWFSMNK